MEISLVSKIFIFGFATSLGILGIFYLTVITLSNTNSQLASQALVIHDDVWKVVLAIISGVFGILAGLGLSRLIPSHQTQATNQ